MDINEFNATAIRSVDGDEIIFDVRPFGDRQAEAIDGYLHARLMVGTYTGIGNTNKLVVIQCDANVVIPNSCKIWLANLSAQGQRVEIRPGWAR